MRTYILPTHQKQRGDTIVEVIISIAVISSVLVGAFYLTNRSTRAVRDSEEHSQALQLLQGQVEQLRAIAPDKKWGDLPANFCFTGDGTITTLSNSTAYGCTASDYYSFVVTRPSSPPPAGKTGLFTLKVQWDSILSNKGNESLVYKVPLKS
jgi:type II secretory pathway pseudopilin PulG